MAEDGYEFDGEERTPRLWSDYPMEEQALEMYTRPIYMRFQAELGWITSYNVRRLIEYTYEVYLIRGTLYEYGSRAYKVTTNITDESYSCECCKFSRDGLLCCHVMKVMTYMAVDTIPQQYILPRWSKPIEETQTPPIDIPRVPTGKLSSSQLKLVRYSNLCNDFTKIAKQASVSEKQKA